ncbi:hypothetical protein [Salibacterium aidingense]|uniref:hypothetical protein n=1 Tax=Salibacterium aidingense TaxID=384933 RepID=UPI0004133FEC|nr:hypothetical protein [Salibacterium aidingense]
MKSFAVLILGAGLLSPFSSFSFPNDLFWNKEKDTPPETETTSEEEWEETWSEAQQEAEKAAEDNRTEEEKLEDFDEEWRSFESESPFPDLEFLDFTKFGAFGDTRFSAPASDTGAEAESSLHHDPSSFEEKWDQFGETFEDTYENETNDSFDWEDSFDSSSGTYEKTN